MWQLFRQCGKTTEKSCLALQQSDCHGHTGLPQHFCVGKCFTVQLTESRKNNRKGWDGYKKAIAALGGYCFLTAHSIAYRNPYGTYKAWRGEAKRNKYGKEKAKIKIDVTENAFFFKFLNKPKASLHFEIIRSPLLI